jgi:hypothetical protein
MLKGIIYCLFCAFCCTPVLSQERSLAAIKTDQPPKIDGNLDDAAWMNAPLATDFIQSFPTFGIPASVKTEVKIIYDNTAIYIGAYLHDDPSLIRKQITSRDAETQTDADYFSIFLDTYNDHQNGFQFLVTSMNVQTDARLGPNLGGGYNNFGDRSWDAIWNSSVSIKSDGWVVEMKIPYISLRFSKQDVQDWGLQFLRFTRRNNESSYWSPADPGLSGFVNKFGTYKALQNIQPPLRLSFSPYISTGIRSTPEKDGYHTEWLYNGGMDVKYGVNESFTLDATLIPDFGQVVSDNVVNNLTPFEVKFTENRPFFTEGTEIFNKSGLFYSRRIGAVPPGYYSVQAMASSDNNLEIVKNPSVTQLYNAIKFSGRTKNKLGIGVFNAVAAPMYAIVRDKTTKEKTKIETAPLTNYNVFVLDQALKGRSYVTLTNASTIRNGAARDANVSAFDFALYDKGNRHAFTGTTRYSKIFGSNPYDGFNTTVRYAKVSGKWQYALQNNIESDKFDPNDLGFLLAPNEITYRAGASYNQFTKTEKFLSYTYSLNVYYNRLYKPNAYGGIQLQSNFFWYFKNFWDATISLGYLDDQRDYFVLRQPGLFVKRPKFAYAEIFGSTDSRKKLYVNWDLMGTSFFNATPDKEYHLITLGLRYRASNRLTLDISNTSEAEKNYIVNADTTEPGGAPIIGYVNFKDITTTLSGIYNFGPKADLTVRLRHYWSKVVYQKFANVDANGDPVFKTGMLPVPNENVNYFNLDAFFTWDFKLGCRLVAGYKNWLGDDENVNPIHKTYFKNFSRTFALRHANELTVKFIYFIDYNQLKKK